MVLQHPSQRQHIFVKELRFRRSQWFSVIKGIVGSSALTEDEAGDDN
jgi:hypothetical protein